MLNKEKILSGVYGLAIGDALGVPVEFTSREILKRNPVTGMRAGGTHKQPKGVWSDDTSMVLATMDAMNRGIWSDCTIMWNFCRWLYDAEFTATGKVFDVGNTTARAIQHFKLGNLLEDCGGADFKDNGNGSLMRMLPVIYYVYNKNKSIQPITPEAVSFIENISRITHSHCISRMCCVYYVFIGVYILRYSERIGLRTAIQYALRDVAKYYEGYEEDVHIVIPRDVLDYPAENIKSSGFVIDTLEASLWSLCNSSSYKEAVLQAVNLGGDTDTIGAITGSLAGLYYGFDSIPQGWINALRNKELINNICDKFYDKYK